jgi:hypothetical protein
MTHNTVGYESMKRLNIIILSAAFLAGCSDPITVVFGQMNEN